MSKLSDEIAFLAEPVAAELGVEIWDVEFVREGSAHYLRIYIDKPDGISIDDCERFSREFEKVLDASDPIEESYIFEVSSAGAERVLKRPGDFDRFIGHNVEIKLFSPMEGQKTFVGRLVSYNAGDVAAEIKSETVTFSKQQVAQVRLRIV